MFALRRRQRGCMVALLLLVAACGVAPPKTGEIGAVEGFLGAAISEEPRAALVARDILSAGGSAADAAVAAYFAMTVTYPVAVGLGGGGVCLYYDHRSNRAVTLDFRVGRAAAGGSIAVPGALRGMALLHSRYGHLPWNQLVAPAETMARFGHQMSRALAKRLRPQASRLHVDRTARRIFLRADGKPLDESETVVQVELASVLTRIRTRGVSDLYGGEAGQQIVQAAARGGGRIKISDLRNYRAIWRGTEKTPIGNDVLHLPALGKDKNQGRKLLSLVLKTSPSEAGAMVFGSEKMALDVDGGQAGLVIGDSFGSSVACVFDMNSAFGAATTVPELGIFMATAAKEGSGGLPVLGVNNHLNQTVMAVSGTGGPNGSVAAAMVAMGIMERDQTLIEAMAGRSNAKGRVQGLWCPKGIRTRPESCQFATDSQWHGLAAFEAF